MIGCIRHICMSGRNKPMLSCVESLDLVEMQLYEPEGLPAKKVEKRLERLEDALCRQGVGRVVLSQFFPYRNRLKRLRPVDALPFYQDMGDVFALEWLRYHGLLPDEARVALASPRLSRALQNTAERLCPQVRELAILVPEGGEEYARALHSFYGLPVTPCSVDADITIAFGPGKGFSGQTLHLYGDGLAADGLRLSVPELTLPEEYSQSMLALLWEYGRLKREEVRAIFCSGTIANGGAVCYNY